MWWSLLLKGWVLYCLINSVPCTSLWDFSRHGPLDGQLQNRADSPVRQHVSSLLPTSLQPVTVQCQEAQMVIVIHRDLFETGHLIQADDLRLGPQGCPYTSASDDLVFFEVGLHECGSKLQTTPGSLIYRTTLYYNPGPAYNPIIVRNSPTEIPIECHYPRKDNISSNAIKPTWKPFSVTMSAEGRLYFSLRLMTGDWSAERASTRYQLGDALHIQADVYSGEHASLRLFVDKCVATLMPDGDSTPQYSIIDFHGCLVDGRAQGVASTFIIPRRHHEMLQFSVDAFRFAGDTRNLIYITCHLKVNAADKEPDLLNKACSFNNQRNIWLPVEGSKDICNCCETGNCASSERRLRAINPNVHQSPRHRKKVPSGSAIVDISKGETEADLVVGPVLVLDAPWDHQREQTEMTAEGGSPVIEAEAESAVGLQFILKADRELRELLDAEETTTPNDEAPHVHLENVAAAKLSSDVRKSSGDLPLPVDVAKMSLQGAAVQKGTALGKLLTIATGILMLVLLSYISWNTYLIY